MTIPVRIIPTKNMAVPSIIALRAPNLSPKDPAKGDTIAVTTLDSAYAKVIPPWLQPNSAVSGSMNTPKAIRIEAPTICITAMILTIAHA